MASSAPADKVCFLYDTTFSNTLMAKTDALVAVLPIVWKTSPSRMRRKHGQYILVNIPKNTDITSSEYNFLRLSKPNDTPTVTPRDVFFNKIPLVRIPYQRDDDPTLRTLEMNLRSYLFHVLMYQQYKCLDIDNYVTNTGRDLILGSLSTRLGFNKWIDDSTQLYYLVRYTKDTLKVEYQKEALLNCISDYSFNVDDDDEKAILGPNFSLLNLVQNCTKRISAGIIKKITQIRESFK